MNVRMVIIRKIIFVTSVISLAQNVMGLQKKIAQVVSISLTYKEIHAFRIVRKDTLKMKQKRNVRNVIMGVDHALEVQALALIAS